MQQGKSFGVEVSDSQLFSLALADINLILLNLCLLGKTKTKGIVYNEHKFNS
jgi:hypothetical protein